MSAITASTSEQPERDAASAADSEVGQTNLLEVREPARSRDVAVEIDPGQESSGDQ